MGTEAGGATPGAEPAWLVRAEGLAFAYGFRRVLGSVSLELREGEVLALLGPNGAGKSTLLRVLAGLLPPEAGTVVWGRTRGANPPRVAFLGHRGHLFPELTARENLLYYARLVGRRDPRGAAEEALVRAGLALDAERPVATFSRGMVQRLALARAFLGEPEVVLADEPAAGLDPDAQAHLAARLAELRAHGGAAVLVTHDLAWALQVADRYAVLAGGRLADGGPLAPWRGREAELAARYRAAVAALRGRRAGWTAARVPSAPRPAAPRTGAIGAGRAVGAVLRRELTLWRRSPERWAGLCANGVLVALVFGFAFDPLAVDLRRVFAGILWLGLLLTALPTLVRSFQVEWETDAHEAFLAAGAPGAALFYGKALANGVGLLAAEAVLVPVFFAFLEVAPGPGLLGALGALLLGSLAFVPAGTLVGAVVSRALGGVGTTVVPLFALPVLAPVVFGTAHLAQGFLDHAGEPAAPWVLLLAAYGVVFWALPGLLFPIVGA